MMLFNLHRERNNIEKFDSPTSFYKNLYLDEFEKFLFLYENFGTRYFKMNHDSFKETYALMIQPKKQIRFMKDIFKNFDVVQKIDEDIHTFLIMRIQPYFRQMWINKKYSKNIEIGQSMLIFCSLYLKLKANKSYENFNQKSYKLLSNESIKKEMKIQF